MEERKKVLSQLNVSFAQTPRVIMGFLKKKWLKLLSKRKSKVNVSIMRLMLIVKLGSQEYSKFRSSIRSLYFLPFRHRSFSQVSHGTLERSNTDHTRVGEGVLLPFLNFTHFCPDSHFRLRLTPSYS